MKHFSLLEAIIFNDLQQHHRLGTCNKCRYRFQASNAVPPYHNAYITKISSLNIIMYAYHMTLTSGIMSFTIFSVYTLHLFVNKQQTNTKQLYLNCTLKVLNNIQQIQYLHAIRYKRLYINFNVILTDTICYVK